MAHAVQNTNRFSSCNKKTMTDWINWCHTPLTKRVCSLGYSSLVNAQWQWGSGTCVCEWGSADQEPGTGPPGAGAAGTATPAGARAWRLRGDALSGERRGSKDHKCCKCYWTLLLVGSKRTGRCGNIRWQQSCTSGVMSKKQMSP